jgi:hypothetical protein
VVTTEFDRWALGSERIRDRLDVLFLDSTGALVVAELKRGEAPDTVTSKPSNTPLTAPEPGEGAQRRPCGEHGHGGHTRKVRSRVRGLQGVRASG